MSKWKKKEWYVRNYNDNMYVRQCDNVYVHALEGGKKAARACLTPALTWLPGNSVSLSVPVSLWCTSLIRNHSLARVTSSSSSSETEGSRDTDEGNRDGQRKRNWERASERERERLLTTKCDKGGAMGVVQAPLGRWCGLQLFTEMKGHLGRGPPQTTTLSFHYEVYAPPTPSHHTVITKSAICFESSIQFLKQEPEYTYAFFLKIILTIIVFDVLFQQCS